MKRTSKKRLILFKLIGVLLPFVLLFVLEIILRFFHYGYNPDLFIEYPGDKNYLVLNPEASKKYFVNQQIATVGNVEPFKKEKDSNTVRLFVLGESTTIGYPYFHNGSFHRWLLYRLMHSVPGKNFEIINLSLTAVNSYTVLGFAKELANYAPDAVLIYTGHNEYYGALGVGSTGKIGGSTAIVNFTLWLRQFKVVQLMTNTYQKTTTAFGTKTNNAGRARMELMVADQQIVYGSDLFNRGLNQFKSNLDATLNVLSANHIPVFISNLVSNEKDIKPFADIETDSSKAPAFSLDYQKGLKAFHDHDTVAAYDYFAKAQQAYSSYASCNYFLARKYYDGSNYNSARLLFSKALNLDGLRFRAPTEMNDIIAQVSARYSNTHLVNAKSAFDAASNGNIIGDELILEHVHPNLKGYALLSDVFYEALKKEKLVTVVKDDEISFEQLQQRMPITSMDSITGEYRIDHLKKSWPFTKVASAALDFTKMQTEEEKTAFSIAFQKLSWDDATQSLYSYYTSHNDLKKAKTLVETLILEHPTEETYYNNAANICGELKDYDDAAFYFRKSFELSPSGGMARFIFVTYFMLDKPAQALPYLDYAISNGYPSLQNIRKLAGEVVQLKDDFLKKDSANVLVLNQVAAKYLQMGNKDGAVKYIEKVLLVDGNNSEALALQSKLKTH